MSPIMSARLNSLLERVIHAKIKAHGTCPPAITSQGTQKFVAWLKVTPANVVASPDAVAAPKAFRRPNRHKPAPNTTPVSENKAPSIAQGGRRSQSLLTRLRKVVATRYTPAHASFSQRVYGVLNSSSSPSGAGDCGLLPMKTILSLK